MGDLHDFQNSEYIFTDIDETNSGVIRTTPASGNGDVLLGNLMPQVEYMFGCTPTALAMLLGYYDLYGYADGTSLSNLIEGNITVDSRGSDGNIYNMNEFDTVLGNFTASEDYVYRFYSRNGSDTTAAQELEYAFVNGGTELNTSVWNCLADYIGTGQYWRGNSNLSTTLHYTTLENIVNSTSTRTITSGSISRTIDYKYTTLLYGLELYVQSRGYGLDYEITGTYAVDCNNGSFTFEDYMAEIDAGRAVLVSIEGHSMVGYGYNADTREIIFDDTYRNNQSMVWDGMYFYSGENRKLQSITVIGFATAEHVVDLGFAGGTGNFVLATSTGAVGSDYIYQAGANLYLSFSVSNSVAYSCGTFTVGVYLDGTKVRDLTVSGLSGNGVHEFRDIDLGTTAAGVHSLKLVIDDGNQIQESSGRNNEIERTFQVVNSGTGIVSRTEYVSSGVIADSLSVVGGGILYIQGGRVNDIAVTGNSDGSGVSRARVYIQSGGSVQHAEIHPYGSMYVQSGVISNMVMNSSSYAQVLSGGSASGTVLFGGSMAVHSSGYISDTVVSGGYVKLIRGSAYNTDVYDSFYASSAGSVVSGLRVHSGGYVYASGGAGITDADISGNINAINCELSSIRLSAGASMTLSSGTVAVDVSANNAWVNLYSASIASNTVLEHNGSMSLRDGAISSDTVVRGGGVVYCWSSGYLRGNLEIAGEVQDASAATVAGVTGYKFILGQQRDNAFLEFSSGGVQANANITVDISNAWGEYILVDGDLSNLNTADITVKSGTYTASATVSGNAVTLGDGRTVTLSTSDNIWRAVISGTDTDVPAVPQNIQMSLSDNMVSFAWTAVEDFSGVRYEIEYADNSTFQNSYTVTSDINTCDIGVPRGSWYFRFRAVDGAGNASTWSSTFSQTVSYINELSGSYSSTVTATSDITLALGTSITASYPGALQILGSNFTVNLQGGNSLSCSSIRNAAILFGEDAAWSDYYGYAEHLNGTVNFNGENISLYSSVGSCVVAAGIVGLNLTVNFNGTASGAESIVFESTNPESAAGNYAYGIDAGGDLTINGDFGGIVNCHFDFSNVSASNRRFTCQYGFAAGGHLTVNGGISGTIYLSSIEAVSSAVAYGLKASGNLSVRDEISGIIAATADTGAYAVYGGNVNITVTGTLFAGKSDADNDMETLVGKLRNFSANQTELLALRYSSGYAVYAQSGNITFCEDALSIGNIRVANRNSVITVDDTATLYGDIIATYGATVAFQLSDSALNSCRIFSSSWSSNVNITVNAAALSSSGSYRLVEADSLSSIARVELMVGSGLYGLEIGDVIFVGENSYSLAKVANDGKETLTLEYSNRSGGNAEITSCLAIIPAGSAAVSGVTVNSGGILQIQSGGTATQIIENGGEVDIASGGTAFFASNTVSGINLSGASMTLHSNTVAENTAVNSGGNMMIFDGGVANGTMVNSWGRVDMSGGTANHTTVNFSGGLHISSGAVANNTTVNSVGIMRVYDGGVAGSTTVNSGGKFYVSGGSAVGTIVNFGGKFYVSSGGIANSGTVSSGGYMYISSGGIANRTILSDGVVSIFSGGTANSTTVSSGGFMYISSGGVANNTAVNSGGGMSISSGGVVNSTTVNSDGRMNVSNGGVASDTANNGFMNIYSGGTANSTTVNSGGKLSISSGGSGAGIVENGGYVNFASGAEVTFAANSFSGVVLETASMTVHSNTVANSTTVNSGGSAYIYDGGVANNTVVNSSGIVRGSSGGAVNHTTVNSGGKLLIFSGGAHRGTLQLVSGAVVSAYTGAEVDFTLVGRTASDGYLINNIALVKGAPTYTITVSATQANGTYKLAQGAANFNKTLTVGDGTVDYGSITVNGDDLVYNGITYSLDKADGNLTLTVSGATSGISNLQASATVASWSGIGSTVEYSQDNFATSLKLNTSGTAIDTYQTPAGAWQVRVDADAQTSFTAANPGTTAAQLASDADGDMDVFFAKTNTTWQGKNIAKHAGNLNGWTGTHERAAITGKNKIEDIFAGSTDANVLVLTDDTNGDALFLDDIYSTFGNQARLSQIDEIRAGAGDDVVDLTSPKFAYVGDSMTVYGGSGNDTIWANSGSNTLYGDAGNDRLVGGSGNDFIIGGAGNDSMHGGGGNDTFCFGGNWGTDTIEQLASGKVILRFESGSLANWNASTQTYTAGSNSVTVIGTSDIELYFGADSTLPAGAFLNASSDKIYESINSGMLA